VLALYDNPISSNALKVRFLLAELGLDYERRTVPIGRPRPQWYIDLNPLGGIPSLDDDGLVLSESNAILRYLANRQGRDDLYPSDPARRARIDMMLDRFSLTLRPPFFQVEMLALGFTSENGFGAVPGDAAAARAKEREIASTVALFDSLVSPSGYWLEDFSIADVAAAPVLFRTTKTRHRPRAAGLCSRRAGHVTAPNQA
jgi:glutathione S-transferase